MKGNDVAINMVEQDVEELKQKVGEIKEVAPSAGFELKLERFRREIDAQQVNKHHVNH